MVWIRFKAKSLALLLEGVESCCKSEKKSSFRKLWLEGERSFLLKLRRNPAGNFLYCSVRTAEGRCFSLVFPEGKGLIRGWLLLASKLRSLGVPTDSLSVVPKDANPVQ